MAAIAQTIAVMDKSGKVVNTSKQFKNIFKEAKSAYMERKAEIVADRKAKEDHELQKAITAMSLAEETRSNTARSSRRPDPRVRPSAGERHHSSSSRKSRRSSVSPPSHSGSKGGSRTSSYRAPHLEDDVYGASRSMPVSPSSPHRTSRELVRSHTDMDLALPPRRPHTARRSNSASAIDMDLAYGEFHPESLGVATVPQPRQKEELSSLVMKAKMLLDEANCAQHSVKAIIAHLQKNPDAMAAVALTLAEISNVVSKMAPGALTGLKVAAPSVFALLAAPEFLIAVGVSVGITVVMFGGYKIIKKIKARNAADKDDGADEMLEIGADVNRIEHWRRGIADVETASVGTSVEGEFITPMAAASMGHLPVDPRVSEVRSGKKSKRSSKGKKDDKKREKSERKSSKANSKASSLAPSEKGSTGGRLMIMAKKPSPLRRMFKRDDGSSAKGSSVGVAPSEFKSEEQTW